MTTNSVSNIARGSNVPVLKQSPAPVKFDPDNKAHRMAFAKFLATGKWEQGALRFETEWPHTSAITTIHTSLVKWALRKETSKIEGEKAVATMKIVPKTMVKQAQPEMVN
jgi:hypothetical protein